MMITIEEFAAGLEAILAERRALASDVSRLRAEAQDAAVRQRQNADTIAQLQGVIVQQNARMAILDEEIKRLKEQEPQPQPPVTPVVSSKPLVPVTGSYLGSSFDRRGNETKAQALARTEGHFGRKLDITHYFISGDQWLPDFEEDVKAGRMPHISVKLDTWANMASGAADATTRLFAGRIKALNGPCFVTYWHEPTNDGTDAALYVKAWRRFRQVMDGEGVQNAAYVWVMIAYDLRSTFNADAWFPGKDVVDWVGADPYNWYPTRPNSSWAEFSRIVSHAVAYAKKVGLPLFIAETGTNEDPNIQGRKALWYKNLLAYLKTEPVIKALVLFNNTHTNNSGTTTFVNHWEVDSTPSALAAWQEVAVSPHFRPIFDVA